MAAPAALARPYARAAFLQAKEESAVAAWGSALELLAQLALTPELTRILGNPRLDADKGLQLVLDLGDAAKAPFTGASLRNFVTLLVRGKMIDRAPEIHRQFQQMQHQDAGVVPVTVQSAVKLSQQQLDSAQQLAAKTFSAKKVELSSKVNHNLLGGLLLQAEDRVLDLSLREKLRHLELALA